MSRNRWSKHGQVLTVQKEVNQTRSRCYNPIHYSSQWIVFSGDSASVATNKHNSNSSPILTCCYLIIKASLLHVWQAQKDRVTNAIVTSVQRKNLQEFRKLPPWLEKERGCVISKNNMQRWLIFIFCRKWIRSAYIPTTKWANPAHKIIRPTLSGWK